MKKSGDEHCLCVASHPVGIESRMQDILQLLRSESKDVIIAGIWGMGGVGKTTIAKAIYNEVGQSFEGKCFLENVRQHWEQNDLVSLQEQFLSDISKARMSLTNVHLGKNMLIQRLCQARVLLVLDDVNHLDQLNALCNREWFGQGSRIIITTRDRFFLNFLRVNHVCIMKELDANESLELFSWHAFKQAIPGENFIELSRRVVSYCKGLPLALEVIGSLLFARDIHHWESVLKRLQQILPYKIHRMLKLSFDCLANYMEKDIFLDICCFFVGKDISYATKILNGCGLHANLGISRLIECGLVGVDNKNKLVMHDLLRDMGREIIRNESPDMAEKRSRLWWYDDVLDVLINETGTKSITGLALNMPTTNSVPYLRTQTFMKMKNLRLLQLHDVQLTETEDFGYLSKKLRWFCWHGFPLKSIPMTFYLEKIVAIDLKWSHLVKVWEKSQMLEGLVSLNLSHSHYLVETPDFSMMPNLEKLIFKDCPHLSTIHPSVGDLKYLVLLNLKDCKSLNHLPSCVYNLKSLEILNLSGCSKIEKLEEDIDRMESLTTLLANQTSITQAPYSLLRMESLKYVSLCGHEGLPHEVFPSIIKAEASTSQAS